MDMDVIDLETRRCLSLSVTRTLNGNGVFVTRQYQALMG